MQYLVLNIRESEGGEAEEYPVFCITKVNDYYELVARELIDDDLCPIGSYIIVVTLH